MADWLFIGFGDDDKLWLTSIFLSYESYDIIHTLCYISYVTKITYPFTIEVLRVKRMHRNWKSWFLSQGHQLFRLEMNKYYLTFLIKPFRIKISI